MSSQLKGAQLILKYLQGLHDIHAGFEKTYWHAGTQVEGKSSYVCKRFMRLFHSHSIRTYTSLTIWRARGTFLPIISVKVYVLKMYAYPIGVTLSITLLYNRWFISSIHENPLELFFKLKTTLSSL